MCTGVTTPSLWVVYIFSSVRKCYLPDAWLDLVFSQHLPLKKQSFCIWIHIQIWGIAAIGLDGMVLGESLWRKVGFGVCILVHVWVWLHTWACRGKKGGTGQVFTFAEKALMLYWFWEEGCKVIWVVGVRTNTSKEKCCSSSGAESTPGNSLLKGIQDEPMYN